MRNMNRTKDALARTSALAATALLGLALVAARADDPADGTDELASLDCVDTEAHVRATAYGYDHLATLTNGCGAAVVCYVTVEETSQGVRIELAPDEARTIVTLRGSPARRVVTRADCEPRAGT